MRFSLLRTDNISAAITAFEYAARHYNLGHVHTRKQNDIAAVQFFSVAVKLMGPKESGELRKKIVQQGWH